MTEWNYTRRPSPTPTVQRAPAIEAQWVVDTAGVLHWWDGQRYTGQTRLSPDQERTENLIKNVIGGIVGLLVVIGGFLNVQETNLLEGSTNIWIGAALVSAGFIFCCAPKRLHWGAMVGVGILAALAIGNAFYVESQLEKKRDELRDLLGVSQQVDPGQSARGLTW